MSGTVLLFCCFLMFWEFLPLMDCKILQPQFLCLYISVRKLISYHSVGTCYPLLFWMRHSMKPYWLNPRSLLIRMEVISHLFRCSNPCVFDFLNTRLSRSPNLEKEINLTLNERRRVVLLKSIFNQEPHPV